MEELDLKELFELFWEKKLTIVLIVIIFAIIGAVYSLAFVTPKYKSSTTLVLTKTEGNNATPEQVTTENTDSITTTDITINSKLVATYSELIKSKAILREVLSGLDIKELSEDDVRKNITVSSLKDTEVIEITVSNENATYAAKIANGIAEAFTKQVAEIYNINNVHIVDKAEVAEGPYNINHKKDIAIFALIGLVVAAGYVLLVNMLDTTVKTSEDIEKNVELPVLATIAVYDYTEKKGGRA
ncbi:MAG: hypothetical protein IKF17_05240 [Clostridia bacterium]|nr:hypothetical protein [Clostridia bacterium]